MVEELRWWMGSDARRERMASGARRYRDAEGIALVGMVTEPRVPEVGVAQDYTDFRGPRIDG